MTLYEYGDLQCPVCKSFSEQIVPEVIESQVRTGEAKLEFRNFTIISQESIPAGAAAVAAGKQGRGWDYIELFYRNQGKEASGYVTDEFLKEIAKGAGVPEHRPVGKGPRKQAGREGSRRHDRRSPAPRLHRHAVLRRRRPGNQGQRNPWNPGRSRPARRSDRRSLLRLTSSLPGPGLHNHHYRALDQAARVARPQTSGLTSGGDFGSSPCATSSTRQRRGFDLGDGVAVAAAAVGEELPGPLEPVLPARQARVLGAHVLYEEHLAAGFEDSGRLGQRRLSDPAPCRGPA